MSATRSTRPAARLARGGSPNCAPRLGHDGCAVLKGFVRADALPLLVAEADRASAGAHLSHSRTNAYFSVDNPALPATHPVRQFFERSKPSSRATISRPNGPLRAIYEWPSFMPFIREALGEPADRFFRYDDPLADVIVNMVETGSGFPWHFDTNNHTVTLAIRNAEAGGDFEYAPGLRTQADENFNAVAAILDGARKGVRTLVLKPGDLQISRGRYALHRVMPVEGAGRRYVGIFSIQPRRVYRRLVGLSHATIASFWDCA